MGLTWLHLSDWHQTGKDFKRGKLRDSLVKDIEERASRISPDLATIDFVVFSGDVAYFGKTDEYQTAITEFFDPVIEAAGVDRNRLFVVPGNHDLSRSYIYDMLPGELQLPFETSELVEKWLMDDKRRARILEPFNEYNSFVAGYTGQDSPDYASVVQWSIGNRKVALLGLNSAWMCARNRVKNDDKNEVSDYGHLVLGEPQLYYALKKAEGAQVLIAVLHHPFDWLTTTVTLPERSQIKAQMSKGCHFILHGHEHEPSVNVSSGTVGDCVIIPAGSSYERTDPTVSRYAHGYNFVHLDFTTGRGIVYLRRYEKRQGWIRDTGTTGDDKPGYLEFDLPKDPCPKPASAPLSPLIASTQFIGQGYLPDFHVSHRWQGDLSGRDYGVAQQEGDDIVLEWDFFICHASEDKETIARPLAEALVLKGCRVWYDELTLTVGDSLSRSIDKGLAGSRYGIVVLSPNFFNKEWPQRELNGLVAKETSGGKVILPIWHNVTREDIINYSPILADKLGVSTSKGLDFVVNEIKRIGNANIGRMPTKPEARDLITEAGSAEGRISKIEKPVKVSDSEMAYNQLISDSRLANARGAWLSVLAQTADAKDLTSNKLHLMEYVKDNFRGYPSVSSIGMERPSYTSSRSNLRLYFPTRNNPDFITYFDAKGALSLGLLNSEDQIHLGWLLAHLDKMLQFVFSEQTRKTMGDIKKCAITLSNWPQNGFSTNGYFDAIQPESSPFGCSYTAHYSVDDSLDLWQTVLRFCDAVLGEAGFIGYENELAKIAKGLHHWFYEERTSLKVVE